MSEAGLEGLKRRIDVLLKTGHGAAWFTPLIAALVDEDWEVRVFLPATNTKLAGDIRSVGAEVARTSFSARDGVLRHLREMWRLRQSIRRRRPDVVHYQLFASALVGRIATLGLPVRRVSMVPGPLFLENRLTREIERLSVRLDDLVICSSSHLYRRYEDLGVGRQRLRYVPYGVDLETVRARTENSRASSRAALGLAPTDFVVVCISYFYAPKRLVYRGRGIKGHDVLLSAWREVIEEVPNARLLLVGGGFGPAGEQYRQSLMRSTGDLGGSVQWIDTVSDVQPYYYACDVSISPSLSENLGAAAEASASGVPSVASAVGGLPEIVIDGVTGWTVPSGDARAIASVLVDVARLGPMEMSDIGSNARRLCEALLDRDARSQQFVNAIREAAS